LARELARNLEFGELGTETGQRRAHDVRRIGPRSPVALPLLLAQIEPQLVEHGRRLLEPMPLEPRVPLGRVAELLPALFPLDPRPLEVLVKHARRVALQGDRVRRARSGAVDRPPPP